MSPDFFKEDVEIQLWVPDRNKLKDLANSEIGFGKFILNAGQ